MESSALEVTITLGQQRWLLLLMAACADRSGFRFVELLNRLNCPRESLVRALAAAQDAGWVARNPGYGHPLRPEYLLTDEGRAIAAAACRIEVVLAAEGIGPADLTRWSLPLLHLLGSGRERFNELVRDLAPATPRALSQSLKALVATGLISREVEAGFPPASRYRLTPLGQELGI